MVEPEFDLERPPHCTDTLVLYATSEQTDYEPLTQTAIELSPKLSTRGPNNPDVRIMYISEFKKRLRLRQRVRYNCVKTSGTFLCGTPQNNKVKLPNSSFVEYAGHTTVNF